MSVLCLYLPTYFHFILLLPHFSLFEQTTVTLLFRIFFPIFLQISLFPCTPHPSVLCRPHSPHHRAPGLYPKALCSLWKIFPGVLQQTRWATAHHEAEALVTVRRPGREIRLVARGRWTFHPLPVADVGDGSGKESLGRRMSQPPLVQLVALRKIPKLSSCPFETPYPRCRLWNKTIFMCLSVQATVLLPVILSPRGMYRQSEYVGSSKVFKTII